MMALPSIAILILIAALHGVGIAVLDKPRHRGFRIAFAGFAVVEILMAIGLAVLVSLPDTYF